MGVGNRVPRQARNFWPHCCASAWEGLQGLNCPFSTCSFGGGVGFSFACPVWQQGISPVISMSLHPMVSPLLDLHASHGYFRQCKAERFCKISRYFPRAKSSSFPCASEVDLAPTWSKYWMCTCPFSTGWVLSSCRWLNKHVSLACSLARLLVTAAQDPNELQEATNSSSDHQADTGKLSCDMSWESSPSLPVTVNEQLEKWGTVAAVTEGVAVLPACTQSCVAFPHGIAISDVIFVKWAVKSWRWLTQARQHSFTASEELHHPRSTASLLQRDKLIKFHHSFFI